MSEEAGLKDAIEEVSPGDSVVFNDRVEPLDVITIEERVELPVTIHEMKPRPWRKRIDMIGPGVDRRDVPRWRIVFEDGVRGEGPTCKLRYRRMGDGEDRWTGHGDVSSIEVIDQEELDREPDPETGVYDGILHRCPDCGTDTGEVTPESGAVDGDEVGESARYTVFINRCRECDHEWKERRHKSYDEDLTAFEG